MSDPVRDLAGALPAARPAQLGDRFLAKLIDGLFLFALNCVLAPLLYVGTIFGSRSESAAYLIGTAVIGVVTITYFALFESWRGQTLGKQLLKLRVVGADGRGKPTAAEALRRNAWLLGYLLVLVPYIGTTLLLHYVVIVVACVTIAVGINKDTVKRQGWHDRFAGGTEVQKVS